jgi:hypothetical protein
MGKQSNSIPARFERLFWDCEFDSLEIEHNKTFIAERILMFGDLPALQWLKKAYGLDFFKKIAVSDRRLDPKTRNFWKIYFDD